MFSHDVKYGASSHVPVSGCSGAFRGQPPPAAACPRPGRAAVDPLFRQRRRPAAWTSRSFADSAQHSPGSVRSAAPPGL